MPTLESLKAQGQASFSRLRDTVQGQPNDVKAWGVTAGSALVGAVAVNATARGVVAILATLASTPVALTVGAVGGGYLGYTYLRNWQAAEEDEAGATPEPVATDIPVIVAESHTMPATTPEPAPAAAAMMDESIVFEAAAPLAPESPSETPTAAPPAEVAAPSASDNLEVINGIGPVYAGRLHSAGIQTFAQLAQLTPEQVRQFIGPVRSGNMIEPEHWIAEARQLAGKAS